MLFNPLKAKSIRDSGTPGTLHMRNTSLKLKQGKRRSSEVSLFLIEHVEAGEIIHSVRLSVITLTLEVQDVIFYRRGVVDSGTWLCQEYSKKSSETQIRYTLK